MIRKTRTCTRCKKTKPVGEFYVYKARKIQRVCKECDKAHRRKAARKYRVRETTAQRKWQIKNTYGLTLEQYDQMFEEQSGVCKTCGKVNRDGRRLYIDHNHETGKVRGLLCHRCNSLLGFVKDDTAILQNIIAYLKEE